MIGRERLFVFGGKVYKLGVRLIFVFVVYVEVNGAGLGRFEGSEELSGRKFLECGFVFRL